MGEGIVSLVRTTVSAHKKARKIELSMIGPMATRPVRVKKNSDAHAELIQRGFVPYKEKSKAR